MTAFVPKSLEPMRRNRDVLFFVINALGWTAWGITQAGGNFLFDETFEWRSLYLYVPATLAGMLICVGLRYVCRFLWRQKPVILLSGGMLAAYIAALPFRAIINPIQWHLNGSEMPVENWYDIFMAVTVSMYIFVGWMGLYFGFHFYEANQRERETALRATSLAQAAQLKMLRYQLNPHFLFNTLNAISTLVLDQKNNIANTVVTRLADFLRYTLDQDPMKTVTLAQEIAALNLYLEIEKMRFGARLQVEIDVEESAGAAPVPSLLLQPLIENAIKYAISPREQGGRIRISGRLQDNDVVLSIEDDGPGVVDTARITNGRGVGLRNTRERLQVMYGKRAKTEMANANPGLRVTLQFPRYPMQS
ncbi:MAG TPA: histidine kinase [Steroidobacteraceae bacterium]|nr:histidine kinase [Steroidobacteraceae bacterium]